MPNKDKWPTIKKPKPPATKTKTYYDEHMGAHVPVRQAKRLPSQRKGYNV